MKVIIIGGGIGGLTLANTLQHRGIDYELYEAASALQEVGAGILLGINAMLVFQDIGLDSKLSLAGQVLKAAHITDAALEPINSMPLAAFSDELGASSVIIHRADLINLLYQNLNPRKIFTGKRAKYVVQSKQGAEVYFQDDTYTQGQVVVGADGIHSFIREQLFPETKQRFLGQTCWRGVVDYKLASIYQNQLFESWGPNGRFAFTALNSEQVYWYAVQATKEGEKDNPATIQNHLANNFANYKGPCLSLIRNTENILRHDIYDLKTPKSWHQKRVALMGDAIHATSPNLGQGGAQAIEDAHILAYYLAKEETVEQALVTYEKKRYPKARRVTEQSRLFGRLAHLENPFWQKTRNQLMRRMPSQLSHKPIKSIFKIAPQTLGKTL